LQFFSDKSGGKSPRAGHGIASDTAMLVSRDGGIGIGDVVDDTESEDDWSDTEVRKGTDRNPCTHEQA
jgi:hypothetical protein